MSATAAQTARLRRMVGEPTLEFYSNAALAAYIEAYPLPDERGESPYTWDDSTAPPTQDANEEWIPTYDLNAAAADIWQEKAARLSGKEQEMALRMARHYRARRVIRTIKGIMQPLIESELSEE